MRFCCMMLLMNTVPSNANVFPAKLSGPLNDVTKKCFSHATPGSGSNSSVIKLEKAKEVFESFKSIFGSSSIHYSKSSDRSVSGTVLNGYATYMIQLIQKLQAESNQNVIKGINNTIQYKYR